MPPKKQQQPTKKTEQKKKERIIEDKTFGLKNKKGKRQQQLIKQVTNQVKYGGQSIQKRESADFQAKQRKVEEQKEKAEMNTLFKPVQSQKISSGADPKSVLCIFYKQGQCTKGDKCKFSHDLTLEGKAEKKSLYVDSRDLEEDTIDKWDEDKLKEVVEKKHGDKNKPRTDIVCKHFLHAIEKGIYGWFWECPSGGDKCIYRHALPPGFVFKKAVKEEKPEEKISMEELVEREREQLATSDKPLTKVTLETFLAWKKRKLKEKREKVEKEMAKKKEAFNAGRTHGISGREMFEFNPEMVEEDDLEATDEVVYRRSESEGEEEGEEGVDVTEVEAISLPVNALRESMEEGGGHEEQTEASSGDKGAVGGIDHKHFSAGATGGEEDRDPFSVVVDESLFDVENLEDLNLDECDVMD